MESFIPTHAITITHADGSVETELVLLIDGAAYTRQEWEGQTSPDWEVSDSGEWLFQGRATPENGDTVEVRAVTPEDLASMLPGWETVEISVFDRTLNAYRTATREERVELMAEFKAEETMRDAYFGTPEEVEDAEDPDALGPRCSGDINWAGFPAL